MVNVRSRYLEGWMEQYQKGSMAPKSGALSWLSDLGSVRQFRDLSCLVLEDDGQSDADVDSVRGGPNGSLSLAQARANYRRVGASDERVVAFVRPPEPTEI